MILCDKCGRTGNSCIRCYGNLCEECRVARISTGGLLCAQCFQTFQNMTLAESKRSSDPNFARMHSPDQEAIDEWVAGVDDDGSEKHVYACHCADRAKDGGFGIDHAIDYEASSCVEAALMYYREWYRDNPRTFVDETERIATREVVNGVPSDEVIIVNVRRRYGLSFMARRNPKPEAR